jgi:predicted ATP-dependent endonuclease of OLD family
MRLTKVTIDSFKTIASPQELLVDKQATILVGANESGKTNVLRAIQLISPFTNLSKIDISKINTERCSKKQLPIFTYTFSLCQKESEKLGKIVPELREEEQITILRKGNGIYNYEIIVSSKDFLQRLQDAKNKSFADKRNLEKHIKELTIENTDLATKLLINKSLGNKSSDTIETESRINVISKETQQLKITLKNITEQIDNIDAEILAASKDNILLANEYTKEKIIQLLPNVIFFTHSEMLPDSLPISEIREQKTTQARIIGNLLRIGKMFDFAELDEPYRTLKHTLKSVSETVSGQFNNFWSQESIDIEIEKQGNDLAISINGGVSISSSPSERSVGLQWILSFFASFAELNLDWKNTIFLFDEPANILHPKGQKDVLNILETIVHNTQIIYSTHSPFLINRNHPERLRLLTKDKEKGTIINNKPYADGKTRFWEPLRSSIGICLGDLLSIGEKNIIVEGISEQIVITRLSKKFSDLNLPFIDLEKFSVVPAMGATCEEALSRFALSEKLPAISLLDNDAEGQRVARHLQKDKQIRLLMVNEIKKEAITIEDLFPENEYIKAFNRVYSRYDDFKEYKKEENADEKINGIVQRLEKYLKSINYSKLDKVAVANELISNLELDNKSISNYSSFQGLFNIVNKI